MLAANLLLSGSLPYFLLFMLGMVSIFLSDFVNADDMLVKPKVTRVTPLDNKSLVQSPTSEINVAKKSINLWRSTELFTEQFPRFINRHESTKIFNIFNSSVSMVIYPIKSSDGANIINPSGINDEKKPKASYHYTCPPTSVDILRKRYGTNQNIWGEWDSLETRQFYKSQLPKSLQIEGALGLTLEERAKLASEARHALRLYARERCTLPDRLLAELFDGVRHMKTFGYWKSDGMDWSEIKLKYSREARRKLGATASPEDIDLYVYKRIIDRSCRTNVMFDNFVVSDVSQFKKLLELLDALKSSSQTLLPPSGTEQLKAIMFPVVALLQVDISV